MQADQNNQPQITQQKPTQPSQSSSSNRQPPKNLSMQHIHKNHPDCIPIFFVKHQSSPKDFPSPVNPFVLFKKQLKIQQAMYNLYKQIEIKGLYFFCIKFVESQQQDNGKNDKNNNKNKNMKNINNNNDNNIHNNTNPNANPNPKLRKFKYIMLQSQNQTIQQIYKKYGSQGYLTLIYGDKNIGMNGLNSMQKWLIRILILLIVVWIGLFCYPYIIIYQYAGWDAVKVAISKIGISNQNNQEKKEYLKSNNVKGINYNDNYNKQVESTQNYYYNHYQIQQQSDNRFKGQIYTNFDIQHVENVQNSWQNLQINQKFSHQNNIEEF